METSVCVTNTAQLQCLPGRESIETERNPSRLLRRLTAPVGGRPLRAGAWPCRRPRPLPRDAAEMRRLRARQQHVSSAVCPRAPTWRGAGLWGPGRQDPCPSLQGPLPVFPCSGTWRFCPCFSNRRYTSHGLVEMVFKSCCPARLRNSLGSLMLLENPLWPLFGGSVVPELLGGLRRLLSAFPRRCLRGRAGIRADGWVVRSPGCLPVPTSREERALPPRICGPCPQACSRWTQVRLRGNRADRWPSLARVLGEWGAAPLPVQQENRGTFPSYFPAEPCSPLTGRETALILKGEGTEGHGWAPQGGRPPAGRSGEELCCAGPSWGQGGREASGSCREGGGEGTARAAPWR